MKTCPYCRSEIPDEATRCSHCTSFLGGQTADGVVTYILDKGLVRFFKFVLPVLGMFGIVGASLFSCDFKQAYVQVEEARRSVENTRIEIGKSQLQLAQQTANLQKDIEAAKQATTAANEGAAKLQGLLRQAGESEQEIERYKEKSAAAVIAIAAVPSSATAPAQSQRLFFAEMIEALRGVLPQDRYAALKSQLDPQATATLHRRVYDAKNDVKLPGVLVRAEGEPPVEDTEANKVFENLKIIHDFVLEVTGGTVGVDTIGSMVVSIHYDTKYNNAFWTGQQIVMGDGDDTVFRKGAFAGLSIMAAEAAHSLTSQLSFVNQSGAINESFAYILGALISQWQDKQTVDQATWLVGEGIAADGAKKYKALVSLKEPGSTDVFVSTIGSMTRYRSGDDFHETSGIPSRAFYELARRTGGYAWEKPFKIWYESVRALKADATFQDLADATVAQATKLYGDRSRERQDMIEAWAVVGITAAPRR